MPCLCLIFCELRFFRGARHANIYTKTNLYRESSVLHGKSCLFVTRSLPLVCT
jgi:hypothetical protein